MDERKVKGTMLIDAVKLIRAMKDRDWSVSEWHVRALHQYDPDDRANIPCCHQLMGYFDALLEKAGAVEPKVDLVKRQWEGSPQTVFDISWS